jgi:ryanodine receptor 2
MYTPNPIDTANVSLSSDILALSEVLARNTHEVWAAGRIAEGWSYGKVRDDAKKHHPCLVRYEELPESEKEYDRATSLETLKVILSLGYVIGKS